jgi:hypothetical protein
MLAFTHEIGKIGDSLVIEVMAELSASVEPDVRRGEVSDFVAVTVETAMRRCRRANPKNSSISGIPRMVLRFRAVLAAVDAHGTGYLKATVMLAWTL